MAKKKATKNKSAANGNGDSLRLPAEQMFQDELDALLAAEKHDVPSGWRLSPRSVQTYICGGTCGKKEITAKYVGHRRLVEIAISTLVTDRALLLIGEPGTEAFVREPVLVFEKEARVEVHRKRQHERRSRI